MVSEACGKKFLDNQSSACQRLRGHDGEHQSVYITVSNKLGMVSWGLLGVDGLLAGREGK